ncbi:DUF4160 domain-containing protein [Proteiniclasticum ruminis]|uniref:DUF4160 domain-containing protein n=1 Tax=Proteiniclasticum ruminis TaxID=398199 RepID=UPI0028AE19EF|nr:DUF4160 domain-containing protein [Proteiniclasticum ruminis]
MIILNELSFEGQFSVDSFSDYLCETLLPMLMLLSDKNISVLKKSDIYSYSVTKDLTFHEYFTSVKDPSISKFKSLLVNILSEDPYWDFEPISDLSCKYSSEFFHDVPNAVTEALERNVPVISFLGSKFGSSLLYISKNMTTSNVVNITILDQLTGYLQDVRKLKKSLKNRIIFESGAVFEVRLKEGNHFQPHFHILTTGGDASYSIPDMVKIAGKIPMSQERQIIEWANSNLNEIIELWNKTHPSKSI